MKHPLLYANLIGARRNPFKRAILPLILAIFLPAPLWAAQTVESDICVYGGAAGGVTAAVQAARQGKKVALLAFGKHLGGMTTSGLGCTDIGGLGDGYIQGMSREFYTRIGSKYRSGKVKWQFEPHVAEDVFNEMVKEAGVSV